MEQKPKLRDELAASQDTQGPSTKARERKRGKEGKEERRILFLSWEGERQPRVKTLVHFQAGKGGFTAILQALKIPVLEVFSSLHFENLAVETAHRPPIK